MKTKSLPGRRAHSRLSLLFLLSLLLLLPPAITSCSDDNLDRNGTAAEYKTLNFTVRVPGANTPNTRALDYDNDENRVETVEILLFDNLTGNYVLQPIYCNIITTSVSDSKLKTFTAKIPEGTYDLVVLTNSRAPLAAVLSSFSAGESKASILSKLILNNADKWNAYPGTSGYISIPMWGEIAGVLVNSSTLAQSINLTRMVAKIDVTVASTAQPVFTLESVDLYNYYNQGQIGPDPAYWTASPFSIDAPTVPSTASKPPVLTPSPLSYTTMTTADIALEGEIYTFEAGKGSDTSLPTNTCLVVGGKYNGGTTTYYRIDFTQTSGSVTTYLDLLRNYHYKVNIKSVSGPGLDTSKDAFESRPVNIQAEVLMWNDAHVTDIVFDGQNMLGVSQGAFTFTKEARTTSSSDNDLIITTDVTTGWAVYQITDNIITDHSSATDISIASGGWLSLNPTSAGSGTTTPPAKLILTENNTGSPRTGFIHLKAGRLVYVVEVTQSINPNFGLSVTDKYGNDVYDLLFSELTLGVTPAPQQFRVQWAPIYENVFLSIAGSTFDFGAVGDNLYTTPSITGTGDKTFNIAPPALTAAEVASPNEFLEKMTKVDFTLTSGANMASKSIYLRQVNYNLLVDDKKSFYLLNGSSYSFHVKSNAAWRIQSVTESTTPGSLLAALSGSDNLKTGTTGGYDTTTGDAINFHAVSDLGSGTSGIITIVFESTDSPKKFNDITVQLSLMGHVYFNGHNGWAGSNIYYDTSTNHLTFDDTGINSTKQGVYFQWGSLTGISPRNVWVNNSTPIYPPGGGTSTVSVWSSWPRWDDLNHDITHAAGTARSWAYLYENHDASSYKGDICKYITDMGWAPTTDKWRMPTSIEFEAANDYSPTGNFTPSGNASNDATGKQIYPMYQTKAGDGSPQFPASGYRNKSSALLGVGTGGYYWSASPNGTNGYVLGIDSSVAAPTDIFDRAYSSTVRCVKE